MRNITVSVDDETYGRARVYAAEQGTSVTALVRVFLERLAQWQCPEGPGKDAEAKRDLRERMLREVLEGIRATRPRFSASENLPREALYDRDASR